jgi:hypothetical protein
MLEKGIMPPIYSMMARNQEEKGRSAKPCLVVQFHPPPPSPWYHFFEWIHLVQESMELRPMLLVPLFLVKSRQTLLGCW